MALHQRAFDRGDETTYGPYRVYSGAYVEVLRSGLQDEFIVLYLRPDGRFLLLGYWPFFERTSVAGKWTKSGNQIRLTGRGAITSDAIFEDDWHSYDRLLALDDRRDARVLTAESPLSGWSLLEWPGPFAYVGKETVIDPDGKWLPGSLDLVDAWIDHIALP